ncbi:Mediator of RNA polymerase II transcription [Echinococcus multilocularis]|uniref:Mediator of RNA polymerase II transcription subunit 23 n=1 Tax=Echinococcus multilocularis TaxID=6211 RepID=A0A068Y7G1_ECHMU|nr:Mediator of RNA polymerase II transcription [Echinococcus multilocularis]
MQSFVSIQQCMNAQRQLISQCIRELEASVLLEVGSNSIYPPDHDSIYNMDVIRLDRLWSDLMRLPPKTSNSASTGHDVNVNSFDPLKQILDLFVEVIATLQNEGVTLRLLWSLDRGIERGFFTPLHVTNALLSRHELTVDNQVFFRSVFRFLLKLVFYLDYKNNRLVFIKTIDKSFQFNSDAPLRHFYNPAVELIQVLLCREINLLPAYFTMYELNKFRGDKSIRPNRLIEGEVERFMADFDFPLRILYSYHELEMVPIAGITLENHPCFRLDPAELTLSMLRQAILYPPAFKTRQLGLACDLLGQLRCTQLASSLLACDKCQAMGPHMTLVGLAISELIFSVMEITEEEKCTDWTIRIFSHLAGLVICFVIDRVVRLNDIISELNSKIAGRTWPISRHFVMWFTLVCMSGFVEKNKLTDFVSCLHLFDQLFPEADELDNATMQRLEKLWTEDLDRWAARHRPVVLKTLEAMSLNGSDLRFVLFSPDRLFGSRLPDGAKSELNGKEGGEFTDDNEATTASDAVINDADYYDEGVGDDSDDTTSGEESSPEDSDLLLPKRSTTALKSGGMSGRRDDEDMTHLVVAAACAWEMVLQMNSGGEEVGVGGGSGGRTVKECHLPRTIPPLLYPLQAQIAGWLEYLKESCVGCGSAVESGENSVDTQTPQVAQSLSWLEFIITLNTYSPNENLQITRSVVTSFWLPSNDPLPGIGGGLPLNNGTFTLPYGLSGAGRLNPLSHRLIQKMSIHLQMIFCNEMRQKLIEMTKPPCGETGPAYLTSPATLETFSRFLSYQVEKNLIILIREIYRRWLHESGPINIPLYYHPVDEDGTARDECHPINDDFYAFTFWLDLLGHRLVEALPAEHRLSYRDELFLRVDLESHELVYALDWIIVQFSRRILTPDCILYNLQSSSLQQQFSQQQLPLHSHSREVTSRVILFSTLQAVCAYDLLEAGDMRCQVEEQVMRCQIKEQFMTMQAETRAIFGEECGRLQLPAVIARFADLLPATPAFAAPPQAPIFNTEVANTSEAETYFTPRERLLLSVHELYNSLLPESGDNGELKWTELNLRNESSFCVILVALINGKTPLSLILLNNILQLPPAIVNAQVKVLCEYLITAISKFEELERQNLPLPTHICAPCKMLSAIITFCIQYGIITMDRLLLYLFVRSNYSPIEVAAVHSIAIFLITQCPQLVESIKVVGNFAPNSSNILTSPRWPELLKRLHTVLPEKQVILLPPSTNGHASASPSTVLRRRPCQPVYYDHIVLRLIPVLEIIFTSFLDNPPPLLQLARFCDIVAPLFRLHSHPMSLCFLLLRGQFHHFSSGAASVSGAAQGATTPNTPCWGYLQRPTWRNPTQVDGVTCQLIIRCILRVHQALAERANAHRECAQAFMDSEQKVCGLLSPPAWMTLDTLHKAAMRVGGCDAVPTDADFANCLRKVYGSDEEIRLASALHSTAGSAFPELESHLSRLLHPVVGVMKKHGLHGVPSAWRDWRSEENVNPQAAGIYAVAVELMVLHPPSDTSRVPQAAGCLMECLRKRSGSGDFHKWLNVTGALVSVLPFVFRHNILCLTCSLIHDPCFNDAEQWPSILLTLKTSTELSPHSPAQVLKVFRRCRVRTDQPVQLTVFEEEAEEAALKACQQDNEANWEVLGRPHTSSVRFFETILPPQLPQGDTLPNHLFKAAVWHAIWSHASLNDNPALLRIFEEFVLKYVNNEAKLLMAFSMITPPMKALSNDTSTIVDLTVSLYKAVQQVDEALAAKGVPLYHVNTIADLLYHIKYTYVGKAVQDEVQGLLSKMRPHLQACLKFVFSTPTTTACNKIKNLTDIVYPIFEDREYRAAARPPIRISDEFF